MYRGKNLLLFLLQDIETVRIFMVFGQIAQLVEQRTENPCVAGSIPALATISYLIQSDSLHLDL